MSSLLPASSTAISPADQRLIGGKPAMSWMRGSTRKEK